MKINPAIKAGLKKQFATFSTKEKETVRVVAPYALSSSEIDAIRTNINDLKNADIVVEVDPRILAGIIIRRGSKEIDLSLRGGLQETKRVVASS